MPDWTPVGSCRRIPMADYATAIAVNHFTDLNMRN